MWVSTFDVFDRKMSERQAEGNGASSEIGQKSRMNPSSVSIRMSFSRSADIDSLFASHERCNKITMTSSWRNWRKHPRHERVTRSYVRSSDNEVTWETNGDRYCRFKFGPASISPMKILWPCPPKTSAYTIKIFYDNQTQFISSRAKLAITASSSLNLKLNPMQM